MIYFSLSLYMYIWLLVDCQYGERHVHILTQCGRPANGVALPWTATVLRAADGDAQSDACESTTWAPCAAAFVRNRPNLRPCPAARNPQRRIGFRSIRCSRHAIPMNPSELFELVNFPVPSDYGHVVDHFGLPAAAQQCPVPSPSSDVAQQRPYADGGDRQGQRGHAGDRDQCRGPLQRCQSSSSQSRTSECDP